MISVNFPQESVPLVAETLAMLLKFVLLVALTILSFGYAYSALALDLYGVSYRGDIPQE